MKEEILYSGLTSNVEEEMKKWNTREVFGKDSVNEEEISARIKKSPDNPQTLIWLIAYDRDKNRRRIAWNLLKALVHHEYASQGGREYLIPSWLQKVVSLARDKDFSNDALTLRMEFIRKSKP